MLKSHQPSGLRWCNELLFFSLPLPLLPLLGGGVYHCSLLIYTPSPTRPATNQGHAGTPCQHPPAIPVKKQCEVHIAAKSGKCAGAPRSLCIVF